MKRLGIVAVVAAAVSGALFLAGRLFSKKLESSPWVDRGFG